MPQGSRPFHNKYRRTQKIPAAPANGDMFHEDLEDVLPLKRTNSVLPDPTAAPAQLPVESDTQIEWECAAAAFKQLAFNYITLLGRTPQDCERDLRRAMEITAKRFPQYRATAFYDETMKLK